MVISKSLLAKSFNLPMRKQVFNNSLKPEWILCTCHLWWPMSQMKTWRTRYFQPWHGQTLLDRLRDYIFRYGTIHNFTTSFYNHNSHNNEKDNDVIIIILELSASFFVHDDNLLSNSESLLEFHFELYNCIPYERKRFLRKTLNLSTSECYRATLSG